ncbi:hypothetical protein [Pseudomonas sp. SDO5591_S426]
MIDSFLSPRELLFFEMIQVRRFRAVQASSDPQGSSNEQPASALASVIDGELRKNWGGQAWSCVDSMVQYLGYCSYWRKRFMAFFGSYISQQVQTMAGMSAVETFRNQTLTAQPFTNLSEGFHDFSGFTAPDAAVNSAPKNGVDHP